MQSSEDRLANLIGLSEFAYSSGRQFETTGEERAQRIVRVGTHVVAHALENGYGDGLVAGHYLQSYSFGKLSGGQRIFRSWPAFEAALSDLPPAHIPGSYDRSLDKLAVAYSETDRKTVNRDGSFETDAMHVIHMMTLALPYAATHHPDLDRSKIAIYILLHDLLEGYAKDVSSLGIDAKTQSEKDAREAAALRRIRVELGRRFPRLVTMLDIYEELGDDEARYTKTFDKLDPKFNSLYTQGISLTGYHGMSAADYEAVMAPEVDVMFATYGRDFPDLVRLHPILTEQILETTNWAPSTRQAASD